MYALSLGVQRVNEVLPAPVYALLSGLNASTVGIIALAAVQLAEKAIKDRLTRVLVILGACAGLCYNALWYFPLLMLLGGVATVIWDGWLRQKIGKIRANFRRKKLNREGLAEQSAADESVPLEDRVEPREGTLRRPAASTFVNKPDDSPEILPRTNAGNSPAVQTEQRRPQQGETVTAGSPYVIRVWVGVTIVVLFFGQQSYIFCPSRCAHLSPQPRS